MSTDSGKITRIYWFNAGNVPWLIIAALFSSQADTFLQRVRIARNAERCTS